MTWNDPFVVTILLVTAVNWIASLVLLRRAMRALRTAQRLVAALRAETYRRWPGAVGYTAGAEVELGELVTLVDGVVVPAKKGEPS